MSITSAASSCMCLYSTAGCETNSDCCPGLQCNVYSGWSQCLGEDHSYWICAVYYAVSWLCRCWTSSSSLIDFDPLVLLLLSLFTSTAEPSSLPQTNCTTTTNWGCPLNGGCCNPYAVCGEDNMCQIPCPSQSASTSIAPSVSPTVGPSMQPSQLPSSQSFDQLSCQPSSQPSTKPMMQTSSQPCLIVVVICMLMVVVVIKR